jgi:hypothetical protein
VVDRGETAEALGEPVDLDQHRLFRHACWHFLVLPSAGGIAEFEGNASRSGADDKGLTDQYAASQQSEDEGKRHAAGVDRASYRD